MLVPLIPFFLVARLAIDENAWEDGPEFVFDVQMNITSTLMSYDETQQNIYRRSNLLCRPKGLERLTCYLDIDEAQSKDLINNSEVDISEEAVRRMLSEKPFEIKFNNRGIEYLIVDENIRANELNNLKNIVELLSIGADLNGIPDGTFEASENSTIGQCNTTFEVNHYPSKGLVRQMKNQRYELESLPQLNKVSGETIRIDKRKNLGNCSVRPSSPHGKHGEDITVIDINPRLAESSGHILVSDVRFTVSVTNRGSIGSYEKKNYCTIVENIILTLKDIRRAGGEIPMIPKGSKSSIVANLELNQIFCKNYT